MVLIAAKMVGEFNIMDQGFDAGGEAEGLLHRSANRFQIGLGRAAQRGNQDLRVHTALVPFAQAVSFQLMIQGGSVNSQNFS